MRLSVPAIEAGTVIDHIPAGQALVIIELLGLEQTLTVGLRLASPTMGSKDVLKVAGLELTPDETNQISILAPRATVNIIRDFKVIEKFRVEPPSFIRGMIDCPNPSCITCHEPIGSGFDVTQRGKQLILRCHYCESEVIHD
jgi:aspartate carbamoyltransferase regulatory subunit